MATDQGGVRAANSDPLLLPARSETAKSRAIRLLIACAACVALGILGATAALLWNLRQADYADNAGDINKLDRVLAEQTERTFESIDLVVASVVQETIADGIANSAQFRADRSGPGTHQALRAKLAGMPELDALSLISAEGDVINFSRGYPVPHINVADRDYFKALRGNPNLERFISEPVQNRGDGSWTIYVARRITGNDNAFIGLVLGAIRLKYFEDFFRDVSLGEGSAINLWRTDGKLVARYPALEGQTGKSYASSQVMPPPGQFLLAHRVGDFNPVPLLIAKRTLRRYPLAVSVSMTEDAIYAGWREEAIPIGIGGLIASFAVGAIAFLLVRQFAAYQLLARVRAQMDAELRTQQTLRDSEERLRQSREHLARAQRIARIGSDERDLRTDAAEWSDESYRLFGVARESFVPSTENFLRLVHPEDRDKVLATRAEIAAGVCPLPFEYRIIRPDGAVRIIYRETELVYDDNGRPIRLIGTLRDVTEQRAAETLLRDSEARLRRSEEHLKRAQQLGRFGSFERYFDREAAIWSAETYRIFGVPESFEPTLERHLAMVHEEDRERVRKARHKLALESPLRGLEYRIVRPDGAVRWVRREIGPIRDQAGTVIGVIGTIQDITDAKHAEEQNRELQKRLEQAQRLEAVGQLTGGLAHDFNNLLGIIIGNLDLLRPLIEGSPEADELAGDALDAALRGADLNRRLLAFARRQPLQPVPVDLNELVSSTTQLLQRTLGENITITLRLAPELWPAVIDPAQLEAAITNLATNARDAMPSGGTLTIATGNAYLNPRDAAEKEVPPGDYAMIEVRDTGTGIAPEVMKHIFEPFFTTKDQGKGTGLGLSMVFGFIKQSGGHVSVRSKVGEGTTFRLYVPRQENAVTAAEPASGSEGERAGTAATGRTVLVVEDNASLRRVVVKQLADAGYRTLECENAATALRLIAGDATVDLMFSDVVMPGGTDGFELARLATAFKPGLKVLMTSGFPDRLKSGAELSPGLRLLSKPYRKEDLIRAIDEVLAEEDAARSSVLSVLAES